MMHLFYLFRLIILALPLLLTTAIAQINMDVLSKMNKPLDFKENTLISRIMATQAYKVDEGILDAFESRCIAANTVDMLGLENAERFTFITEKAQAKQELSLEDTRFMEEVSKRYLPFLSIVAEQCATESKIQKNLSILKDLDPPNENILEDEQATP